MFSPVRQETGVFSVPQPDEPQYQGLPTFIGFVAELIDSGADFEPEKDRLVTFAEHHAEHLRELRKNSREALAKMPEPSTIPTDPFTAKDFYATRSVRPLLRPLDRRAAEITTLGQQELYPILEIVGERFPKSASKLQADFQALDLSGDTTALAQAQSELAQVRHHDDSTGTLPDLVRTSMTPLFKDISNLDPAHKFLPADELRSMVQATTQVVSEYQKLVGTYQTIYQLAHQYPEVTRYLQKIWDQLCSCVWQLQFIQSAAQERLTQAEEFKNARQFASEALGRLPELAATTASTEEAQWLQLVIKRLEPLLIDSYRLSGRVAMHVPRLINKDHLSRNDKHLFTRILTSQQAQLALLQQAVAETMADSRHQLFTPSADVQQELRLLSQRLAVQFEQPPAATETPRPAEQVTAAATIQDIIDTLAETMPNQPKISTNQPGMTNALVNMGAEISRPNKQIEITAIKPGTLLNRLQILIRQYRESEYQVVTCKQHLASHPLQVVQYYTAQKDAAEIRQNIRTLGHVFYKIISEQQHPIHMRTGEKQGVLPKIRQFFAQQAA